jgi:hypothetical protein
VTASGERPSVRVVAADRELDAIAPARPGLRKTYAPEPVSRQHAEFLTAYRTLIKHGWTVRAIARHLGISHSYLIDLRRGHRPARNASCDWIVRLWDLLASVETADSRSGTEG